jgi:hypothetical protein
VGALVTVLALTGCQAVGSVVVVAGTGVDGNTGDGGQAVHADLGEPMGVTAIPGGGFYVADNTECVIRKVDAAGTITTFAGDGTCGYSGDGGPATDAEIRPTLAQGVAVEPDGSVLFSSYVNDAGWTGIGVVRKVAPDGTISTIFGPTTYALTGFTGSPDGTVYVVDSYPGNATYQTTTVSAVAPDGTSSVVYSGSPILTNIAYLGQGQLAVDQFHVGVQGTIDRLDVPTGTLTSTGFTQAVYPGGLVAASDGTIYATGPNTVVRIATDDSVTTVAGGGTGDPLKGGPATSLQLWSYMGLGLTSDDGLLISSGMSGHAVLRLQLPSHSS